MKRCSKCNIEKDESEFHRNATKKDGFSYRCKACCTAYNETAKQRAKEARRAAAPIITDLEGEEWRPIAGYGGFYQVSNLGRVKTTMRTGSAGGLLKPRPFGNGYLAVILHGGSAAEKKSITVHSLVAAGFIGERPDGLVIDHIDRNKLNNRADNLRYCTQSENLRNVDVKGGVYESLSKITKKMKDGSTRTYEYTGYHVRITDREGKRLQKRFKTREEAEAQLVIWQVEHKR